MSRNRVRVFVLALCASGALGAETRAYWWHQLTPPPVSSTIAPGTATEFIAAIATDTAQDVIGFEFTVRYTANDKEIVEERMEKAVRRPGLGVTASTVIEVRGAGLVSVEVRPLLSGPAVKATGGANGTY